MTQFSSRGVLGRGSAEVVIARLRSLAPIGPPEEAMLRLLQDDRQDRAGVEIVGRSRPSARVLVMGWAARVRWLPDGRRQILSFVLPGDGLEISRKIRPLAACAIVSLTTVHTLDATPLVRVLERLSETAPLSHAVRIAAAHDELIMMDQIVRLGRLTAYERIAHLILELRYRMRAVGLGDERRFPFPVTQDVLADASGLSIVHVNRTLQQLRKDKLIELHHQQMTVLQPGSLADISDYQEPGDLFAAAQQALVG